MSPLTEFSIILRSSTYSPKNYQQAVSLVYGVCAEYNQLLCKEIVKLICCLSLTSSCNSLCLFYVCGALGLAFTATSQ